MRTVLTKFHVIKNELSIDPDMPRNPQQMKTISIDRTVT